MENRRVLITGGAGFIGSHTCDVLIKANYDVIILDSLSEKTHNNHKFPEYLDSRVIKVKGNVLDENVMLDLSGKVPIPKIIDFGYARFLKQSNKDFNIKGVLTPFFIGKFY